MQEISAFAISGMKSIGGEHLKNRYWFERIKQTAEAQQEPTDTTQELPGVGVPEQYNARIGDIQAEVFNPTQDTQVETAIYYDRSKLVIT